MNGMGSPDRRPIPRKQRQAAAKLLRETIPRESFAECRLPADRNALAVLASEEAGRIAHLLPERRRRMAVSAFSFYRGGAAIMAADLKGQPMVGLGVQSCGDCHLMNFGAFASPEGHILFDVNDFDETLPNVDFTVDIRRLAASLAVAADDGGLGTKRIRTLVTRAVRCYRRYMRDLASLSPYEVWRQRIDLDVELKRIDDDRLRTAIRTSIIRAEAEIERDDAIPHLIEAKAGPRFEDRDGQIYHDDGKGAAHLVADAERAFGLYPATLLPERRALLARYALVDTAFKVVGVGSVGTLCAIGLYATPDGDRLVLQLKEARESAVRPLALQPTPTGDDGRRVVEGQRAMQAASDIFLGWMPAGPEQRCFYVRHLKTRRLSSITDLVARDLGNGDLLAAYADLCGRTLARAHGRTGDPAAIAAYLGGSAVFDEAIAEFALAYTDVTQADHAALAKSVRLKPL